jgi:proteasome lid subunit RPN8/RPN11
VRIPADLMDELVAYARAEAPNECCGIVGTANGEAVRFYPARNRFESPMRFEVHPDDLHRIYLETSERGEEIALFHSHPRSEAYPSQTDVNLAGWWPGSPWLIASLADSEPIVRGFEIDGTEVRELELDVD